MTINEIAHLMQKGADLRNVPGYSPFLKTKNGSVIRIGASAFEMLKSLGIVVDGQYLSPALFGYHLTETGRALAASYATRIT